RGSPTNANAGIMPPRPPPDRESSMANPLTVVIFGASGDLTARKLVPALFHLFVKNRPPADTRVVGTARSELSDDEVRAKLAGPAREADRARGDAGAWKRFAERLHYVAADAAKPGGLEPLRAWLDRRPGDRLYYLSVAPELVPEIAARLGEAGMARED